MQMIIKIFTIIVILSMAFPAFGGVPKKGVLRVSGDNSWVAYVNGKEVGRGADWQQVGVYEFELKDGFAVIAVYVHDAEPGAAGRGGFLCDIILDNGTYIGTGDPGWKASSDNAYLKNDKWTLPDFDDSKWSEPQLYEKFGGGIWGFGAGVMRQFLKDPDCKASWIWAGPNDVADDVFFRYTIGQKLAVEPYRSFTATWGRIKLAN